MPSPRALTLTAAAVALLLLAGTARAQVPTVPGGGGGGPASTTSTTSTTERPTTTTTERPTTTTTGPLVPTSSTTSSTTTTQPGTIATTPSNPTTPGSPDSTTTTQPGATNPAAPETGEDVAPTRGVGPFPPELKALMDSVVRTKPNSTRALVAALQPLRDLGVPEAEITRLGFGRFPVGAEANWADDWWFPRFGPGWRLHQGNDIFAAYGAPVRAPIAGTIHLTNGGLGGLSTYVYAPDGSYVYMTHLSAQPEGLAEGLQVQVGDVVGFVGTSGDAAGTSPHLHFEYHPPRTATVTTGKGARAVTRTVVVPTPLLTVLPATDPKPFLDAWVADALANVPALVARYQRDQPQALVATALTRRLATGVASFDAPKRPTRSQLLWASSASPTGGALALAEAAATDAAQSMGWRTDAVPVATGEPGRLFGSGTLRVR